MAVEEKAPGPLDRLLSLIAERLGPADAPVVQEFARAFVRRLGQDGPAELAADALYGEVVGAFQFASQRDGAPAAVRAFNPSVEEHGYDAGGAVVETNTEDLPFLVDSVAAALKARGLGLRRVLHPILGTERAAGGRIARVIHPRDASTRESFMHFDLERRLAPEEIAEIEDELRAVLEDVRRTDRDRRATIERLGDMARTAQRGAGRYGDDDAQETVAFLDWLERDTFILLGYREDVVKGDRLRPVAGSGLGLLAGDREPRPASELDDGELLIVNKASRTSTVARRALLDAVRVRRLGDDGAITGEHLLVGLFTPAAYAEPATQTPIIDGKLRRILASEDLIEGSHDYKAAVAVVEAFPKDELFAAHTDDLRRAVMSVLSLQGDELRLYARRARDGRSVALILSLPRAAHSPRLLDRVTALLARSYGGAGVEVHEAVHEGERAQVHFAVHAEAGRQLPEVDASQLQRQVLALARTWDDALRDELVARHGAERGRVLTARWARRLPDAYKASVEPGIAVHDVDAFEGLTTTGAAFTVGLQNESLPEGTVRTRVALYKTGGKVELSGAMPMLEDLGLRVIEEAATRLDGGGTEMWVQDFGVLRPDGSTLDLEDCKDRVAECIAAVWRSDAESDVLNRLVVDAGLNWRQVGILRAYRKFRQRIGSRFTEGYQNEVIVQNPSIMRKLMELFELRFDPAREPDPDAEEQLRAAILEELDAVVSLDHDRVLRNQLGVIEATVRTNAYKPGRNVLSFKLRSAEVPAMPKPAPLFEIFVYSPEVEGVHLRGGEVARGGIRWSDRMDYRTEVFGLMRAQMTKNAIIVPTGAKGGFYVKRRPADGGALREEVRRQYVNYIQGLLDVTDNRQDDTVVHPQGVRVHDAEDAYLVVAADKGTATFSDTANEVSRQAGFWLGDAFASGGSTGYDHKALGITARGAWESLKRHFRDLELDPASDEFTVVGIGDMSGDVFGNGMLLSDRIRLVAAYDHRHVFIDPDPDAARSFEERKRLFALAGSSWDDYDRELLSEGGGVWPRSAKAIELPGPARAALGLEYDEPLTPTEVIRAILRAPVDVLWNGGIGTFVKASSESDEDAADRSSDAIRVDADELRARVVVEGGNLGLTQRARIEYAADGGRVNADFIDNAAGVSCSDHEVNLKILLDIAVKRDELTVPERNELLESVTDDIVDHVLLGSFAQAQILAQEEQGSAGRLWAYEDLMDDLEDDKLLDRDVERLPHADELGDRRRAAAGMRRPELAVLIAYAKRSLTNDLLASDLPDDPVMQEELRQYFPAAVVERFGHLLTEHPLRRELVATQLANRTVDELGCTFISRVMTESGASAADAVRAQRIAVGVTGSQERWQAIEALGANVDAALQWRLLTGVDWLVKVTSRWYLAAAAGAPIDETVARDREPFARLAAVLPQLGPDAWRTAREEATEALVAEGVPEDVARRHAYQPALVHGPDIIAVARELDRPVEEVGRAFFGLRTFVHLEWLEERIEALPSSGRTQRWALQALRDDVHRVRRELASQALAEAPGAPADEAVEHFFTARQEACRRLERFTRTLSHEGADDLAGLTIALRQLRALVGAA